MKIKRVSGVMSDYLAAVSNEISFDTLYFAILKSSPETMGYLPRVPKWVSYSQRNRQLTRFAILMLRAFWLAGGASVLFALQALKLVRTRTDAAGTLAGLNPDRGFILPFTSRTVEMELPGNWASKATWIIFPWAPIDQLPTGAARMELANLLTLRDIVVAYGQAVRSVYLLAGRARQKRWVLQSYTAFHWFAVRRAVDKLEGPVLTTEHFDRWAILVDSSFARRSSERNHGLTLVQHGGVESVTAGSDTSVSTIRLPRRLRAVNELWVYDQDAEKIFRRDVFSARCSRHLSAAKYFKPSIELTQLDDYPGLRVLFVGHSLCEAGHEALYRRLRKEFELMVYYKPHPRTVMSAQLEEVGWTVLRQPTVFPKVDLLISYPSTLVTEYRNVGVASVVHPLDIHEDGVEDFYDSVVEMLKELQSRSVTV